MKKITTLLGIVVALAGAGGAAWWLQNKTGAAAVLAGGPAAAGGSASGPGAGAAAGAGPNAPGGAGPNAGPNAGRGGPVAVEVGKVEVARIEDDALAVGSLRAVQGVMLRPEVSGRISRLGFTDGQRVKKGQLLVQLDDALQQAQLQQAQAQASIARTNLQRNRELLAQNFVSQSVVDQAQAALDVAQAQVAVNQAQLQRMAMLAPFDGLAGIRVVNIGDYVKDGADLVQIEDVSSVWVDFRLPERTMASLKRGQPVALTLDALPGKRYTARVEAVDAQLDASGRSLLVRAKVANTGGDLRSGMFARARTVFGVREAALTVPEEALVPMGDQQLLIKVIDGPKGGKISQRITAKLGARTPGRVEVLEGLAPGDWVVIAGHTRLLRGEPQPLRIVQTGARSAGGAGPGAAAPGASGPGASGSSPAHAAPAAASAAARGA